MRTHQDELLRERVMIGKRHVDELTLIELVQGAGESRPAKFGVFPDIDDAKHLDLFGLGFRSKHKNPFLAGAARGAGINREPCTSRGPASS